MNRFACYHKPTKCWVYFKEHKQYTPIICLCLKPDASTFESKDEAEFMLKQSEFDSQPNYGSENFLEFTVKNI